MGGVTADSVSYKVLKNPTSLSSQKKPKLPDIVELPLVIANGCFRSLDKLEEDELEDFLRYICLFTAGKENRSRFSIPKWWLEDELTFTSQFAQGSRLMFSKEKVRRMRHLVKAAYKYYSARELLELSSKFSQMHILSLQFKTISDGTIIVVNKAYGSVLVRIPVSNVEYDFNRLGKEIRRSNNVRREVKLIEVVTLDDENTPEEVRHSNLHSINKHKSVNTPGQIKQKLNFTSEPIVLSDSDDDVPKKNSIKSSPKTTPLRKSKHSPMIISTPKKKIRLMDKLNRLQKNGSVSFYPCIDISDYEDEDDDDDCQIVDVQVNHKDFPPENLIESIKLTPIIDKCFTLYNKESANEGYSPSEDKQSSTEKLISPTVLSQSTIQPISQDEFLSTLHLIKKVELEKLSQKIQTRKTRRQLTTPLYHMPLEILPVLVARGVINNTKLIYNPEKKTKKSRKSKPRKKKRN